MKQKLITLFLTLIVVLTPSLIVVGENYNILKFWALMIGALFLIILLLANYKSLTLDKKDIVALVFLLLIAISTFLSSDIKKSIFGETNRSEGLLTFITYLAIYFSAKKYFKYEKVETFLNIMFYVCTFIGILGIFQNYISNLRLIPLFSNGICATFGNSNFFGSFISIILPIAICFYIFNNSQKGFVLSLIMFFNLLACGTRSGWVAFSIVGLLGIIYLTKQKRKDYWRRLLILSISFVCIFAFLLYRPQSTTKPHLAQKFEQLEKDIAIALDGKLKNSTAGSGRIEIWQMTLKLIAQKPLFGCGTDNLKLGLLTNCTSDCMHYFIDFGTVVDKAHNEYLQIAATIGIPAMIVYLLFLAMILLDKAKHIFSDKVYFVIIVTILSYLAQAFFNISTIGVSPLFWMILGLLDNSEWLNRLKQKYFFD